jgi:hypothetical protein
VNQQGVVGGHPQLAGGGDRLTRELAREGGDVLVHLLGQHGHLLPSGREHVARAVPLEELDPEIVLHLSEAPEHGGMVDAQALGRSGEAIGFGNDLHQPEIVPVEMLLLRHSCIHAKEAVQI